MRQSLPLYVHIPFCEHICGYCDFTKLYYNSDWARQYVATLFHELNSYQIQSASSIYVGGGTPSSLSCDQLESLLAKLSPLKEEGTEFTFEANPESLDEEKIRLLVHYGVNRVSLGMQTASPSYLKLLGRRHSFSDVQRAVSALKKAGIDNINVDLMYALPGESDDDLIVDLEAILSLEVDHISAYSLILEDRSIFKAKGIKEAEQDIQANQYEIVLKTLREHGYRRYEVSNYTRKNKRSKHNLAYWNDDEYVGIGLGASGYLDGKRYTNTKSLRSYLGGITKESEETIDEKEDIGYFLMTNLRKDDGFSLSTFKKRFGFDFLTRFQRQVDEAVERGLARLENGRFFPTDQGILLLDTLTLLFL